jgi:hypothetical protein
MHRPVGNPAHRGVIKADMADDFFERVRMADMNVAYRRVALRPTLAVCAKQQTRQRRPMRKPLRSWRLHHEVIESARIADAQ